MKKILKLLGALSLLGGFAVTIHAAQFCNKSDMICYESGSIANMSTLFRVDSAGNQYIQGNMIQTTPTTSQSYSGALLSNASQSSSLSIPVLVSTNVLQGYVIVTATATTGNPLYISGVYSTTTGATQVLGVADVAASSGTVVSVDYSGLSVVLATGTINVGDLLATSATYPGLVVANNSASAGSIVGTSLTTLTAATSPALIRALVHH